MAVSLGHITRLHSIASQDYTGIDSDSKTDFIRGYHRADPWGSPDPVMMAAMPTKDRSCSQIQITVRQFHLVIYELKKILIWPRPPHIKCRTEGESHF